jgi:hypothetical protein
MWFGTRKQGTAQAGKDFDSIFHAESGFFRKHVVKILYTDNMEQPASRGVKLSRWSVKLSKLG